MQRIALLLAAGLGLAIIAACVSTDELPGTTPSSTVPTATGEVTPTVAATAPATSTPRTIRAYSTGEAAEAGAIELTLEGVEFTEDDFLPAAPGNHYLFAQFLVRNVSAEPYVFAASSAFVVFDETDTSHEWTFTAGGKLLDLTIPVGGSIRGHVMFEVPQDRSTFDIVYIDRAGEGRAFWSINAQSPPAATPLTPVAMEQALELGDTAEIGSLRVTVERMERSAGTIYQPEPGHEFILLSVHIENTGDQVELVVPDVQGFLLDRFGFDQLNAFWILPEDDPLLGELGPREGARGQLAFEVRQGETPLYLLYTELFGDSVEVWRLD